MHLLKCLPCGLLIKDTKHHRFLLLKKEVFAAFMRRALERTGQLYAEFCTGCCWSHCFKKVSQETDSKTEVEWEVSWGYRSTAGAWEQDGAGHGAAMPPGKPFLPHPSKYHPLSKHLSLFFFFWPRHVASSSPARDRTHIPYTGSVES